MEATEMETIVGEVLKGVGTTSRQRRDGSVIQIKQIFANRELVGMALPEWEFRDRTFYNFTTHPLYNTLIMTIRSRP
jgi:hypothetical protein